MRTDEQTENLLRLAEGLMTLPRRAPTFDMGVYDCGTAACAAGHGPRFVAPMLPMETWSGYVDRVFGTPTDASSDGSEWRWCFSPGWASVDNTPWGAAARILWMVLRGVPRSMDAQMSGDARLRYLPRGVQP